MVGSFTDNLKVKSGREIQVDEMEYHRREEYKKKGVSKISLLTLLMLKLVLWSIQNTSDQEGRLK